jgi:hypothetical protein
MLGVTKKLLSVGSITNKGCHVVFNGRQSLIINSKDPTKLVVVIGNKDDGNGLYKFQLQPNTIPFIEKESPTTLWH